MKSFWKTIQNTILGRDIPLEERLSARMIISSSFASFLGMIVCLFAHTHIIAVILTAILAFGLPIFYSICIYYGKRKLLINTLVVGIIIGMPFIFLYGGGIRSGMSLWLVYEILYFALSLTGTIQVVSVVAAVILSVGSFAVAIFTPYHYVLQSNHDILVSILGSTLIVSAMVLYMTNFQKKLYNSEYAIVENQKRELDEYASRVERANRSQKIFLANMSHEVRSPMNVVLGFNRLICESNDVKEIHEFARSIESAGESLLVIINDILDYSKIEAGKMDLFPSEYDLDELAFMCHSGTDILMKQKGLTFEWYIDPTIPKTLYGDNLRIRQCVTNLLTNALKYTHKGLVQMRFMNNGITEENGIKFVSLSIIVADTGIGISEDQKKELFTRFQRLDESTNRAIEGTGLGLALTKSIVDMMGGSIDVESFLGRGSRFTINLRQRVVKMESMKRNVEEVQEGAAEKKSSAAAGLKILVVDDNNTNLVLMNHILKQMEATPVTASSGLETLERVRSEKYDIIFMDHMMPDMDGVETFRRMKKMEHLNMETPVIMLTANAMSGAAEEYAQEGFAGYLSKPVRPEAIEKELERIQASHATKS